MPRTLSQLTFQTFEKLCWVVWLKTLIEHTHLFKMNRLTLVKPVMRRDRRFAVAIWFPGVKIIKLIMTLWGHFGSFFQAWNSIWMMKSFAPDTDRHRRLPASIPTIPASWGWHNWNIIKPGVRGCRVPRRMIFHSWVRFESDEIQNSDERNGIRSPRRSVERS